MPSRRLQMFTFAAASFLLCLIAPRVDHLNSGVEELEVIEPAKSAVGGNVVVEKVSAVWGQEGGSRRGQ